MQPHFQDDHCTLYRADVRDVASVVDLAKVDAIIADPPYGISYRSNMSPETRSVPNAIRGDDTTEIRDFIIGLDRPTACFATWRCEPPTPPRACLVWDKGEVGMGALDLPWRPSFEVIWIYGHGWHGHREGAVLRGPMVPVGGPERVHPHQKPEWLYRHLLERAPDRGGVVLDPTAGSGAMLAAARALGRRVVGFELEDRYCDAAAERMAQGELF